MLKISTKMAQDGPRLPPRRPKRVQEVFKFAQDASKIAQDGLKTAQGCLRMALEDPKTDGPRGLQEALQDGQKMPKSPIFIWFLKDFGVLDF